jgi:DNA mismatch repair ATPase MutS
LCNRIAWAAGGGIIEELLNLAVFYELHIARRILSSVQFQRPELLAGFSALCDLESLLSLAAFAWETPHCTWPVPTQRRELIIAGGRHPLIPPQRVVANDLRFEGGEHVWIVTGSNMSGKSTLLRVAGVNALLAQCGSAVPAQAMNWVPVRLMSDLRARDNLAREESYFLAEVRQLKRMLVPEADNAPVLGLIDEPFRGTNSDEQTAASLAVLRFLLASSHFYLVATHDHALTRLADGGAARNVHFQENLQEGALVFDYRLREGPAETRNAIMLLELEGYPESVIADARRSGA